MCDTKQKQRTCVRCGQPNNRQANAKYCSRECGRIATGDLAPWDNSPRKCKRCDTEFTPVSKTQIFCSRDCRYAHTIETHIPKHTEERDCVICKKGFVPKFEKHITCSAKCSGRLKRQREEEKAGKAICVTCNNEFQPTTKTDPSQGRLNKYCSQKCRNECNEWRFRNSEGESKWLTYGTEYRPYYPVYFHDCKICSKFFAAKAKYIVWCSGKCKEEHKSVQYERILSSQREKYSDVLDAKKAAFTPKELKCKECSKGFKTHYGDLRKNYCSDKCSTKHTKRVAKAVRRAREKAVEYENVNPFAVFDRDKWRCKLCGIKTPKKLRGQMVDNAPELDHIIPLSQGGPHTYDNVQCACRKCNGNKSDKIIGQIPLFAYRLTA